ncbi:MAG: DPP IV N-terminal domain-containing protein [Sphingobacteriaceae bacterium]|nr:DPP IV N-terminal domain-containing protein [Sphingobacteriaceae bacterium]
MRKILVIALILHLSVNAQEKLLTIQEAVLKGRTDLAPKRLQNIQFVPGINSFFYVDNGKVIKGDNANGKTTEWFKLSDLNVSLKNAKRDTLKAFPGLQFKDANTCWFNQGKDIVMFDLKTKAVSSASTDPSLKEEDADEHKATKYIAFTKDHNLYVNVVGDIRQISIDGTINLVYGGKNVHQNEFGIGKGTFWSPKGNLLAFYRMDQSDVFSYPIIDWKPYPAKNEDIKYPMAGSKSHYVTLGVYNIASQSVIYLKTKGPKDHYLTNVSWSPDEKFIYIAELNREQNFMQLNEYNASNGDFVRTLFEEKDEKYVEPLHEMIFVPNKPQQFIWHSRRDGFTHLYLYDISGKLVRQITSGPWEVKSTNGFDAKSERFFFHANGTSPVNQDFYSVSLKTGEIKKLTGGSGTHVCMLDASGNYFIDNFSSVYVPREYNVVSTKGKSSSIFKAENPIKDYKTGSWNLFTIKNSEGTDLYCRMFKPVNFDSTKKYPVLVYLYNGPHSQMVLNTWMAGGELWYQYMAQKGFIVFTVDGRGTSYRGKAFEQAIHRQLGKVEMEDQLKGVDYLKSLPFVDANRIGVHGWSYGGFMTTSLMTRNPGVYKVGVAGGPVIDWSHYEIMYGERYMDTPQENKEGYDKNNLLNHVGNLKGKLLMIHGAQDPVVVWQHSMMYVKKCVDKGVQIDYFVYPGHEHNVLGKDRAHLMEKICNYFIDNL